MLNSAILDVDELAAKPLNVTLPIDNDRNQLLQRTLTSSNGAHILDDVTNQDSSVLSSESNGRHKLQKKAHISPDEARLLGTPGYMPLTTSGLIHNPAKPYTNRQPPDPNAVQIMTPGSKVRKEGMGHQGIPRGFQPMNTLGRQSLSTDKHYKSHDHPHQRKRHVLDTETSTGDNVLSISPCSKISIDLSDPPQPKRPKLASQHSSDDLSSAFDPRSDPRSSVGYTVSRPPQLHGRSQGKGSQGPSNYSQATGTGRCPVNAEVKEFRSVEKRLRNGEESSSRRRRHKSRNHLQSDDSSTAIEMPTNFPTLELDPLQSTPLDQREIVDPDSRLPYKGTAKIPPPGINHARSTSRLTDWPENSRKLRLNNAFHPHNIPNVHHLRDSSNPKEQGTRLNNESLKLKEKPNDSHGKREGEFRDHDLNSISSDELASTGTAGQNAQRMSPPKFSGPKCPARPSPSQKAISSSSNANGFDPSITPSTAFTSSKSIDRSKKGPAQQTTHPGEKEAPWGIDLSCVNVAEETGEPVHGPNLGLVFNDNTKVYEIQKNGRRLSATNRILQIQPQKVIRVQWSEESSKVRFEFSKTGTHDSVLDIVVGPNERVSDLLDKLNMKDSHNNVKVKPGNKDWMDKIFEKRHLESKIHSSRAKTSSAHVPQDIQIAVKNKERRDVAQDELSKLGNYKRRRGPCEADQGVNKLRLSKRMEQFSRESKSRIIFDQHLEGEVPMDKIPRKIPLEPTNPHLRGSRSKSEVEPRNSRRQSPTEEFPRHLRYSVTEGLGTPWSRPLLYPKTGKKKISVEWIDLERLDEGEFLNDNLIAFYLRFLQDQLEERSPELAKSVYFFNTFFFASLTNTQRGKRGINYEAVQKWTRSVDIFSYDYVVVPINESAHWYVAIICNLPTLASDPDMEEDTPKDEPPLSPDDHDDPIGLSTRPLGRDSSSVANVSVEETCLVLPEVEDAVEQDPSASFAEMSLGPDSERRLELGKEKPTSQNAADNSTFEGVGQAMVDVQMKGTMTESATSEQRKASSGDVELKEMKDNVAIFQSHSPKSSPVSRKRKRKSIPPTQRVDPSIPLILTFDSLGLAHPPTVRILKDYLLAEGKAKRAMELDVSMIKGMTAKQIPQQDNMCDCGLFLLGYIDKFLDDPKNFITNVIGHKYDLGEDWSKLTPSDLRANIRTQIQALHAEQESERLDERRERAKGVDKYHGRPLQHADAGPSSNAGQLQSNPLEALEALRQELATAAEDILPGRPLTREMALETARTADESSMARQTLDVSVKQIQRSRSDHSYQDSSDPLHQDMEVIVPLSRSPLLQEDSSLIVIESQSDPVANKGVTYSGSFPVSNQRSRSVSVELPSTIEDSQPSPFQDLLEAEKSYPKTLPQLTDAETENQRSARRGGMTEPRRAGSDEYIKDGSGTKKAVPKDVKIDHQTSSRRHKQTLVPEIVELDD